MVYRMVSRYGNVIYEVKTEREREEFIRKGFHEEPQTAVEKPKATANKNTTSKKRGNKK